MSGKDNLDCSVDANDVKLSESCAGERVGSSAVERVRIDDVVVFVVCLVFPDKSKNVLFTTRCISDADGEGAERLLYDGGADTGAPYRGGDGGNRAYRGGGVSRLQS